MKTKITLAEIGNPDHNLTMIVPDSIDFRLLENIISAPQEKKYNDFVNSCKYGWYSTQGFSDCRISASEVIDQTYDENGNFRAGNRVYDCGEYWAVHFLTNWQGQRDELYLVPKTKFHTAEDAAEVREYDGYEPIWKGARIQ